MKTYLSRRIPVVVAAGLALAMLALGFLAALGVRSLVAGTASANPAAPNPGHLWTELENHGTSGSDYWLGTTASGAALELKVNNARALRLEPDTDTNRLSPNVIAGSPFNSVDSGVVGATIGGGGSKSVLPLGPNSVKDNWGTVGGGYRNTAGGGAADPSDVPGATVGGGVMNQAMGDFAAVGGGDYNRATGDYGAICGGSSNWASGVASTIGGGSMNTASGSNSTVGGGASNGASQQYAAIGGGSGNTASGDAATVGGGGSNTASGSNSTVGGGASNVASQQYAAIGGGYNNDATAPYATIGGGGTSDPGDPATANRVTDDYGVVGGGGNNQAGNGGPTTTDAIYATVAGGISNTASEWYTTVGGGDGNTASADSATVGGGRHNTANGSDATVGGGAYNTASSPWATVGGGGSNQATGQAATVPGGGLNTAQGSHSLAAGHRAKANHDGSFVWADISPFGLDFASTAANQFSARSTGGARFVSAVDSTGALTAGVTLAPGGNAWAPISDRSVKANFEPVDGQDILERLASLPIETWNLKSQDASIRHIGPMAQDFYAAFGVGEDDTHITTVDADGVALAAIQGLYQLSQEQAARIQALETQNASLQQRLDNLEARVSALEGTSPSRGGSRTAPTSGLPWLVLAGGLALVGLVLAQRRVIGGRR